MTDTGQLGRSVSNLQGAEWPGPKLSRSGSTVEWPDLQQDVLAPIYREHNGQTLS
jgi:hypothetical protein